MEIVEVIRFYSIPFLVLPTVSSKQKNGGDYGATDDHQSPNDPSDDRAEIV